MVKKATKKKSSPKTKRTSRKRSQVMAMQRGRIVDGMEPGERSRLMMVLAATGVLLVLVQLFGMIWFAANTSAMNEPVIPEAYHMLSLVILGFGGLALAISLAVNRKVYVAYRVWSVIVLWGLTVGAYLWWYKVLPYLYG